MRFTSLVLVFFSLPLLAEKSPRPRPLPEPIRSPVVTSAPSPEHRGRLELGGSLGLPAGINANLGYWEIANLPIAVRLSGMFYSVHVYGTQTEIGYVLPDELEAFRHLVGIAATTGRLDFFSKNSWKALGVVYAANWHGFSAELGLSYFIFTASVPILGRPEEFRIYKFLPTVQVGYSLLF